MNKRWAHSKKAGFTVIELIIVIVVIAILATLGVFAYNSVQHSAADRTAQSDLELATNEMTHTFQAGGGTAYPTSLPSTITASPNSTLTLKKSGNVNHYDNVTAVQNGVLLAQICQDLVNEGVGKATNQGGTLNAYITGCGNWNHNSMQITGWDSKVYNTPVSDTTLLNYADNFTTSDTYNKSQITVVKNFYHQLVERLVLQGGYFPVTSFWDSWATPSNGGVIQQPLGTPTPVPYFCIEATSTKYSDVLWHVTEDLKIKQYSC
jgi:prepilin-type N-terminal cleavage/methylation domain-containing protein